MKKLYTTFVCSFMLVLSAFMSQGCDDPSPNADRQQAQQQEKMALESNAQVGMPGVMNFTEKKIVRKLYELRDTNIATYSYIQDMQGRLWYLCPSIGYGLPYGVQYTNPEKHVYDSQYNTYNIPQTEPNGLFMPPTAEGTWIICSDEKVKGNFQPMYVEPRVIVSPFPLKNAGSYQ